MQVIRYLKKKWQGEKKNIKIKNDKQFHTRSMGFHQSRDASLSMLTEQNIWMYIKFKPLCRTSIISSTLI